MRNLLGFDQDKMASYMEVSKATYCRYEAGKQFPRADEILTLYNTISKERSDLEKNGYNIQWLFTGVKSTTEKQQFLDSKSISDTLQSLRDHITKEFGSVETRLDILTKAIEKQEKSAAVDSPTRSTGAHTSNTPDQKSKLQSRPGAGERATVGLHHR